MFRPLRIELAGGLYHVTSRGDRREGVYLSDGDRLAWLDILGAVCKRLKESCHAWCQMDNHDHAVSKTPVGNLSQGMRQLNGVYTQYVKGDRHVAIAAAFRSGDYTMKQLPEHFGVHYATVSRAVRKGEGAGRSD
jgi:putative transposase